ncbi:MAG: 16S rRNA (uracil(1498)-N(3))-methyltransferase [bacterium]|nr:16S rRNA (uracil(1498)-N(3))-methyltransferase [bacterium]
MTTVFITPEEWAGERVELEGAVHHHLFRVVRLAVGDSLRLADGAGRARLGVIESVSKALAEVRLGHEVPGNEAEVDVQLLVVAPKKPRAEWLVEKATELGVRAVRFLRSERGPRSYGEGAFERFQRIARSAAEQCERARAPEITGMHESEEVASLTDASAASFVLDPSGGPLRPTGGCGSISLLVGPEGGWSSRELEGFAEIGIVRAGWVRVS